MAQVELAGTYGRMDPMLEGPMAPRGIQPVRLDLTPEERATLARWTRRRSTAQALALRARIVLACVDRPDEAHGLLAEELGVHRAAARAQVARCRSVSRSSPSLATPSR